MKILVTGAAGFIGFHLIDLLLKRGEDVVGLDNINDYYDVNLKFGRLEACGIHKGSILDGQLSQSTTHSKYRFVRESIENFDFLMDLFGRESFDVVVNLAAQAGVRYSLHNPQAYVSSNVLGFVNILEACRKYPVKHLVYASSSSVYGSNTNMPFNVEDPVNHPVSIYAATKRANELMAHTYSHLYSMATTGLRFFTVYGPWGRPDMAPMLFADAIYSGNVIKIFNNGDMERDFTYIDDIVDGIVKVIDSPAVPDDKWDSNHPTLCTSYAPFRIYNIGNSSPVKLMDFILALEKVIGKNANKEFLPMQPGDVVATWADIEDLKSQTGYNPQTSIESGVEKFIRWYESFYRN
ncbi:NAD-dependent epimerase [Pedobacter deserti]|uniref:NAD-dependent epimerase n=1 Tax=Pedobacter deserti TaxID=2817382 RepID=UPI00210A24E8|nr:NAD-dependent epimerase [Pedobacter sp. SYSU D00382]